MPFYISRDARDDVCVIAILLPDFLPLAAVISIYGFFFFVVATSSLEKTDLLTGCGGKQGFREVPVLINTFSPVLAYLYSTTVLVAVR